MNVEQAWDIYDASAGKAGRPSAEYTKAKAFLVEKGLLGKEAETGTDKKDKKPPLVLELIKDPLNVPPTQQVSIYMEALTFIADKRNFDFDYYLLGKYGLLKSVCKAWEIKSEELQQLRTLAFELVEHKLLDAINDKWSGGDTLGNMLTLKAVYGYSDRGEGGSLMVDGNIDIVSNLEEADFEDVDYEIEESEELDYDNEESVA